MATQGDVSSDRPHYGPKADPRMLSEKELARWRAAYANAAKPCLCKEFLDHIAAQAKQLAAANQAREQAETQLSAWREAFATNQLTHAKAESEAIRAENKRVRAERDALTERLDNSVKAVLDIDSAIAAEDATLLSIREARDTAGFLRVVMAEGPPPPEEFLEALRRASEDCTEGEGGEGEDECRVCGGDGGINGYTCEACGGTGKIRKAAAKEGETPCDRCGGTKTIRRSRTLDMAEVDDDDLDMPCPKCAKEGETP